eukprot:6473971-Amphidinium_carterae.1
MTSSSLVSATCNKVLECKRQQKCQQRHLYALGLIVLRLEPKWLRSGVIQKLGARCKARPIANDSSTF